MRLDKYLAETAQCTRSEAKALLAKGRVTVNGAVCRKGDTQLKEADAVAVDGKALAYRQFVYLMLNKPEGVVSASTDKRDTTVVDLVGDAYPRRELFPAGRLDKTSTGFVLLTDDGGFAHDILAPKRHVSKTYTVVIDTPLTEEMKAGFAAGVTLADGTALSPAEVSALTPDGLTVRVLLRQGVYHQIKRMFGVYGAGVNALHRDAIGGACAGREPCCGPVAGADSRRGGENYHGVKDCLFYPVLQKSITILTGKIALRTTQERPFLATKIDPER